MSANESVHETAVACDLQSVEENVHDAGGILSACKRHVGEGTRGRETPSR